MQPFVVRLTHWVGAAAMVCMMMSGWLIYNASPLFAFHFPAWATLGGWLGGAVAWHLAAMWVLGGSAVIYTAYCVLSQRRAERNVYQLWAYRVVFGLVALAVLSGLAIWKPVQLQAVTRVLGGYEFARLVHFAAMAGIAAFVVGHVAIAAVKPRLIVRMVVG